MSRYYVAPQRRSGENPIGNAIASVGRSIAETLENRRRERLAAQVLQEERTERQAAQAAAMQRQTAMDSRQGFSAARPTVDPRLATEFGDIGHGHDPIQTAAGEFYNPLGDVQHIAGDQTLKRQQQEQKVKQNELRLSRVRELNAKGAPFGISVGPDSDLDAADNSIAMAVAQGELSERGTKIGFRPMKPGEPPMMYRQELELAEQKHAQRQENNRLADEVRRNQEEEKKGRIGRLQSHIQMRNIADPLKFAHSLLTQRDRQLGISPIDIAGKTDQKAQDNAGAIARKEIDALIDATMRKTRNGNFPNYQGALRRWEGMGKDLIAAQHGEQVAQAVDKIIRDALTRMARTGTQKKK